jgi:hypothetical protein
MGKMWQLGFELKKTRIFHQNFESVLPIGDCFPFEELDSHGLETVLFISLFFNSTNH